MIDLKENWKKHEYKNHFKDVKNRLGKLKELFNSTYLKY